MCQKGLGSIIGIHLCLYFDFYPANNNVVWPEYDAQITIKTALITFENKWTRYTYDNSKTVIY